MSPDETKKANEAKGRPSAADIRETGGGRFGGLGMPAERTENFANSTRRLLERLRPQRWRTFLTLLLAIISATLTSLGPRQLGHATDIVFNSLRPSSAGRGIDFGALHTSLWKVLSLYAIAAVCSFAQARVLSGVVQRTMFTLRADV